MAPPSLLSYLTAALSSPAVASTTHGTHPYSLTLLRSQPQRSHALFPHATNAGKCKVYHEEMLVVLSENRAVPKGATAGGQVGEGAKDGKDKEQGPAAAGSGNDGEAAKKADGGEVQQVASTCDAALETAAATPADAAPSTANGGDATAPASEEQHPIPLVALEATLYTVPSTCTTLLYISKVDTTGLSASSPPPTRALVSAFIAYHLLHPPHGSTRVRIHIFARAQGQYLFPGSVDNEKKRVLDDKGLCRWWKGTVERGVKRVEEERKMATAAALNDAATPTPTNDDLRLFYLIPGLSYLESIPYVPLPAPSLGPSLPLTPWSYSHPYFSLSSPLHSASIPPSALPLPDLIPAFPDDPKSRFLHSLTSSAVSSSGTEGDYDDVFLALSSMTFTTGQPLGARKAAVEAEVERERKRLTDGVPGGVEEWWERMAFRQECCSGQLVGFFVVAAGEPSPPTSSPSSSSAPALAPPPSPTKPHAAPRPAPHALALRPPLYTKLWSTFHNQPYDLPSLPLLAAGLGKWRGDLERLTRLEASERRGEGKEMPEGEWKALFEREVSREFTVVGTAVAGVKRAAEGDKVPEAPKVNVLAPRKKKKKVEA
ncbi:hypothetical protein JCM6882_002159 [Rhodosporidiobolus microsporus]